MRRELRGLPGGPGDADAEAVGRHLSSLREVAATRSVALYAALPGEVSTRPFFEELRSRGRSCLLPRLTGGGELEFAPVGQWEDLRVGRYGVAEPVAGAVSLSEAGIVVVPGQAFDATGRRLGRGGGHYDRALAKLDRARCLVVGVAWSRRLVAEVPAGEGDQRVDAVVTEEGVIRTGGSGG